MSYGKHIPCKSMPLSPRSMQSGYQTTAWKLHFTIANGHVLHLPITTPSPTLPKHYGNEIMNLQFFTMPLTYVLKRCFIWSANYINLQKITSWCMWLAVEFHLTKKTVWDGCKIWKYYNGNYRNRSSILLENVVHM